MNKPFEDKAVKKAAVELKAEVAPVPTIDAPTSDKISENGEQKPADPSLSHPDIPVPAMSLSTTNGAVIPKRPPRAVVNPVTLKRPRRSFGWVFIVASLTPILLALCILPTNPAAMPLLKGFMFDHDFESKTADLTKAYEAGHDLEILRERARTYGYSGDWTRAQADLQTLIDAGVKEPGVYQVLGTDLLANSQPTPRIQGLLKKAALLEISREPLPSFVALADENNIYQALYRLLASGDNAGVLEVCSKHVNHAVTETDLQFFKAAALREMGKNAESEALLASLNKAPYSRDKDSEPNYFQALALLDESKTTAADLVLRLGKNMPQFRQNKSLRDLVTAFWLFQKGDYSKAFKYTHRGVIRIDKHYTDYRLRNEMAAESILRAHIYLKLNDHTGALSEFKDYKDNGAPGTIFIPKVYRDWITAPLE